MSATAFQRLRREAAEIKPEVEEGIVDSCTPRVRIYNKPVVKAKKKAKKKVK